ncbi:MAG: hypothetical protein ACRCXC_11155 [Legionella sp.]
MPGELRNGLKKQATTQATNYAHLQKIITELDQYIKKEENHVTRRAMIELRARVQVVTFELTPLFAEALAYIKEHAICVAIQQYLDTRMLGG